MNRMNILPDEKRQITEWQVDSTETRENSHDGNTNDSNSADELRHSEEAFIRGRHREVNAHSPEGIEKSEEE